MTSAFLDHLAQNQSQIDRNKKSNEGVSDVTVDNLSSEMELKMKIQINQSEFDKENDNGNKSENLGKTSSNLSALKDDISKTVNIKNGGEQQNQQQNNGDMQNKMHLSPSKSAQTNDCDPGCISPNKSSRNQSPQLYYSNLSNTQQKSMTLAPCGSSSSLNQLSQPSTPGSAAHSNSNFYNYSSGNSCQNSPPSVAIDPCNLIVNYIPLNITEEQLRMLFATYGSITRCKLVTDKYTGCSLGYGFVKYEDPESASTAIAALNGYTIANKRLKVSVSKPPEREKKTNLYISGLPTDWTQAELEELVSQFGVITEVRVLYDAVTRKGKGVGFARFESMSSAAMCIGRLNGVTVDGGIMPLIVKYADTPADKIKKASMMSQTHHQHSLSAPYNLNVQSGIIMNSAPSSPMQYDHQMRSQPVSPFGYEASQQPASAISPRGLNLAIPGTSASNQMIGGTAHSLTPTHGMSTIATTAANAPGSLSANATPIHLTVNPSSVGQNTAPGLQLSVAHQPTAISPTAHNTNQSSNFGVPVSGPVEFIGYCLFVYHLPLEATEQTLYQLFSNYATVTSAKIMRDLATGRSKGFGFVNVLTEAQAHTAISQLNGFQISNKYLKVAFKK